MYFLAISSDAWYRFLICFGFFVPVVLCLLMTFGLFALFWCSYSVLWLSLYLSGNFTCESVIILVTSCLRLLVFRIEFNILCLVITYLFPSLVSQACLHLSFAFPVPSLSPPVLSYVKLTFVTRSVVFSCFIVLTVVFCGLCCIYFPWLIMSIVSSHGSHPLPLP